MSVKFFNESRQAFERKFFFHLVVGFSGRIDDEGLNGSLVESETFGQSHLRVVVEGEDVESPVVETRQSGKTG